MSILGYFKSSLNIWKLLDKIPNNVKKDMKNICRQVEDAVLSGELDMEDKDVRRMVEEYRAIAWRI